MLDPNQSPMEHLAKLSPRPRHSPSWQPTFDRLNLPLPQAVRGPSVFRWQVTNSNQKKDSLREEKKKLEEESEAERKRRGQAGSRGTSRGASEVELVWDWVLVLFCFFNGGGRKRDDRGREDGDAINAFAGKCNTQLSAEPFVAVPDGSLKPFLSVSNFVRELKKNIKNFRSRVFLRFLLSGKWFCAETNHSSINVNKVGLLSWSTTN